jgi:hypothetical protein
VYQIGVPPRRIDILTSIDGVGFGEAHAKAIVRDFAHLQIPFLGLQSLIANKKASGRPKDLADLEALAAPDE